MLNFSDVRLKRGGSGHPVISKDIRIHFSEPADCQPVAFASEQSVGRNYDSQKSGERV